METTYFGVAYVRVLPPRELYIPVLPGRYNEKIMFTLCHTCADEWVKGECEHTRKQQIIKGIFTTPELKLAIDKGFEIIDILEVWTFKPMIGLFTEYVKTLLKWKTEASGLPEGIANVTNEELFFFIEAFEQQEDVK